MSRGLLLVIPLVTLLVIALIGGFAGRIGGYGYGFGYGHGGVGVITGLLIAVLVLVLAGRM